MENEPNDNTIVSYEDVNNKFAFVVFRDFPSTTAQTATNYGYIFTPPFPYQVLSVVEKHDIAGTVAGATLDVLKVPNGTTLVSGASILATPFDVSTLSTADTAQMKSGLELKTNRNFEALDSIALKVGGTLTTLEGVQVTIYIKPLNMGQFKNY